MILIDRRRGGFVKSINFSKASDVARKKYTRDNLTIVFSS
jgi:hypothetical protein